MVSAIVVGGNYAGLVAAKILAKAQINVTVISPNTTTYLNSSVPRLLVEPEKIDKILIPIDGMFRDLGVPVKHIPGTVTQWIPESNQLKVKLNGGSSETIDYENVVIATGSRAHLECFKLQGLIDSTVTKLKELSNEIRAADNVAILGGNALGVELAGELKTTYKDKTIDIYNSGSRVLSHLPERASKYAEMVLKGFGVRIFGSTTVDSYTSKTVTIKDEVKKYNLVIPALGVKPNSEFIPKRLLDDKGYLNTNPYFQVGEYKNALGFGEINSITDSSIHDIYLHQETPFKKSLRKNFLGEDVALSGYSKGYLKALIALGKDDGLGYMYCIPLPTWVVRKIKSEGYMIPESSSFL